MRTQFIEMFKSEIIEQVLRAKGDDANILKHCQMLVESLDDMEKSSINMKIKPNWTKACRHLEVSYKKNNRTEDKRILELLAMVDKKMEWTEGYSNETKDKHFLENFSYGEIIGPRGIYYHESVTIGLTIMGPNLYYPWHYHPAVELYYVLNTGTKWGINKEALVDVEASTLILHPSMVPHATMTGTNPMVALWFWTGDTLTKSRLLV